MSRCLRETAERSAEGEPVSGLGREWEKLAIDGLAFAALARVRSRSTAMGLDKMTPRQIAAALTSASRAIDTRNPRDFVPAADFGLRVLSPSEARREFL